MRNFSDYIVLFLLMLIGLYLRLDFLIPINFVSDADEAIVGLMAKHINDGEKWPVFYYGQHYMGSLEPILTSFVFKFFGISNLTLKIVPLCFAIALIPLTYFLALYVTNRTAAIFAAALMAIPPAPLMIWSVKARGGFVEIVFLASWAALVTLRWLKDDAPKLSTTLMIGFILGVGWWTNNQIIFYMLPIGFVMLARFISEPYERFKRRMANIIQHGTWGFIGFFLGSLPFWLYNFNNKFISFEIFGAADSKNFWKQAEGFFNDSLPIILGAERFWDGAEIYPKAMLIFSIIYLPILALLFFSRFTKLLSLPALRIERKQAVEFFVLIVATTGLVFVTSSYGYLYRAPRYLLPMYPAIFVLIAYVLGQFTKHYKLLASFVAALIIIFNLGSSYAGGRAIPGEPFIFQKERVARDHRELIAWLEQQKITWVQTNYWLGYRLAFETQEKVRFVIFQEPHQVRINDYQQAGIAQGQDTLPLILAPSQAPLVREALKTFGQGFAETYVNGYVILYNITKRCDFGTQIVPSEFSLDSTNGQDLLKYAVDGDLETRWGSSKQQKPGMKIYINFSEPTSLSGLEYAIGKWVQDYPRGLQITGIDSANAEKLILPKEQYAAVRYLTTGEDYLRVCFPNGSKFKSIILEQTGQNSMFDWSIGELNLFSALAK